MKLFLILSVIAACTFCGHALAGAAVRRKQLLEALLRALRILRIELNGMAHLGEALSSTQLPLFLCVREKLSSEKNAFDAWCNTRGSECIRGHYADCLTSSDLLILDRLFSCLGTCSREEQSEMILHCISSFEESYNQAKDHSCQIGKVYTSLGFLSGLALTILLI